MKLQAATASVLKRDTLLYHVHQIQYVTSVIEMAR
jgi:hypothetical protein